MRDTIQSIGEEEKLTIAQVGVILPIKGHLCLLTLVFFLETHFTLFLSIVQEESRQFTTGPISKVPSPNTSRPDCLQKLLLQ